VHSTGTPIWGRVGVSLYIRLRTSFWTHRKTVRLRAFIGVDALWLPQRLWSYAAENQPDGDFSQYSAQELALFLNYERDPQAMLEALQQAGFMDGMKIHDWEDHNGYHIVFAVRARAAAKARWKKEKKQKKEEKTVQDKTRQDKSQALLQAERSNASSILSKLLEISGFGDAWDAFIEVRKKKRAPMTPYAARLILQKLSEQPQRAVEALDTAIQRNWTGFEWQWLNGQNGDEEQTPRMSPQHRQNKINFLNDKKQKLNRAIKDPRNPPSWAVKELAEIDAQLQKL